MKTFILILLKLCSSNRIAFLRWKNDFEKTYDTPIDENIHYKIWMGNYKYVEAHNKIPTKTYEMELNAFADHPKTREKSNKVVPHA